MQPDFAAIFLQKREQIAKILAMQIVVRIVKRRLFHRRFYEIKFVRPLDFCVLRRYPRKSERRVVLQRLQRPTNAPQARWRKEIACNATHKSAPMAVTLNHIDIVREVDFGNRRRLAHGVAARLVEPIEQQIGVFIDNGTVEQPSAPKQRLTPKKTAVQIAFFCWKKRLFVARKQKKRTRHYIGIDHQRIAKPFDAWRTKQNRHTSHFGQR